jgi:hypothetical protein
MLPDASRMKTMLSPGDEAIQMLLPKAGIRDRDRQKTKANTNGYNTWRVREYMASFLVGYHFIWR